MNIDTSDFPQLVDDGLTQNELDCLIRLGEEWGVYSQLSDIELTTHSDAKRNYIKGFSSGDFCSYCQNTSGRTDIRGNCISCGAPLKGK